ncbi:hypothetical protein HY497_00135 [Candidatus Woesearchaeota archaeon]|nr:hypothetical protein [Candidatus Woesearchaeota archaeon]
MTFDQQRFNTFILEHEVVKRLDKPITLASGRTSDWYVNWRDVASDAYLLNKLADFIVEFIITNKIEVDTIYGVPEGATKMAVIAGMKLAQKKKCTKGSHIIAMGRAKPKEHGMAKDRYFIGMPQGKTLLLEDTTTTGGSLLRTMATLEEAGVDVSGVLVLTDRNELRDDGKTVSQFFKEKGIPYYAMSRGKELK